MYVGNIVAEFEVRKNKNFFDLLIENCYVNMTGITLLVNVSPENN